MAEDESATVSWIQQDWADDWANFCGTYWDLDTASRWFHVIFPKSSPPGRPCHQVCSSPEEKDHSSATAKLWQLNVVGHTKDIKNTSWNLWNPWESFGHSLVRASNCSLALWAPALSHSLSNLATHHQFWGNQPTMRVGKFEPDLNHSQSSWIWLLS